MPRYFRTNTLKQSLAEDIRIARWRVPMLWIFKLLRQRIGDETAFRHGTPFADVAVAPEQVPETASAAIAPLIAQAETLGFLSPLYQVITSLHGEAVTTSVVMRHADGTLVLRIVHIRMSNFHPPIESLAVFTVTPLGGGRSLTTSNQRKTYASPPGMLVCRKVGADLPEIVALHRAELARIGRQEVVELVRTDDEVMALTDRIEDEALERNVRRGLYELVPDEEVLAAQGSVGAVDPPQPEDAGDDAILREVEALQQQRTNWTSVILIGLVSMALFLGVGGLHWDWEFALILLVVLIVHEGGHYVAMRIFGYRNLRVFFIPLLGAAVSGQNYNVAGWKKALVFLAGPLPGIAAAFPLGILAYAAGDERLAMVALISLALNGINLLPFIPLDGGWVLHAVLFCRHHVLDGVFRIIAALALIGATLAGLGRIWMILGILMGLGIPLAFRLARTTRRLRTEGLQAMAAGDGKIPRETALTIVKALREQLPGRHAPKLLAAHVLSVFEQLNARPPGALASVALLLLHLGGGVAAVVGTGLVFAARSNMIEDEVAERFSPERPSRILATIPQDPPIPVAGGAEPSIALHASFGTEELASAAMAQLEARSQPGELVTRFGAILFVATTKESAEAWTAELRGFASDVQAEGMDHDDSALVTLWCEAPDEASASRLRDELLTSFETAWLSVRPAWTRSPSDPRPEERDARARAWRTWRRVTDAAGASRRDPEAASERAAAATTPIDTDTLAARADVVVRMQEATARAEDRAIADLVRAEPDLDAEIVALAHPDGRAAAATLRGASGPPAYERMGLIDQEDPAAGQAAMTGSVARVGMELHMRGVIFRRTDLGLPALVSYLAQQGCSGFRYDVEHVDWGADE